MAKCNQLTPLPFKWLITLDYHFSRLKVTKFLHKMRLTAQIAASSVNQLTCIYETVISRIACVWPVVTYWASKFHGSMFKNPLNSVARQTRANTDSGDWNSNSSVYNKVWKFKILHPKSEMNCWNVCLQAEWLAARTEENSMAILGNIRSDR